MQTERNKVDASERPIYNKCLRNIKYFIENFESVNVLRQIKTTLPWMRVNGRPVKTRMQERKLHKTGFYKCKYNNINISIKINELIYLFMFTFIIKVIYYFI